MLRVPFQPPSFSDLVVHLHSRSFAEQVLYFRELGLLSSVGVCEDCHVETRLDVPEEDTEGHSKRYTQCNNKECAARHRSRRTLFFKSSSIFEHFPHTEMRLVVLSIFCFAFQITPNDAAVLIGGAMSAGHVGHIFEQVRRALQWYNNSHFRGPMGGCTMYEGDRVEHALDFEGDVVSCVVLLLLLVYQFHLP